MARIVPKLNLNKTPQIVENNSLIFAKNIKVMKDGSIVKDDGIIKIDAVMSAISSEGQGFIIKGVIPHNTSIYFCLYKESYIDDNDEVVPAISRLGRYDELTNQFEYISSSWTYNGGTIVGEATVNLNSDIILTIAEYGANVDVPIKFVNVTKSSNNDDESIYTQSPKIPFINLLYSETYCSVIPNGTYQFFIRYEIKKDFYTNWFPCSRELFSGTPIHKDTVQGSIKYVDTLSDSTESFVFSVDYLTNTTYNYKSFQIGFILAHDDEVVARSWKHFDFGTTTIYFDYDKNYIEEVNIDDMLESVYQLYNVKNIANFKNKLYISNYKETNLNPDLSALYEDIKISLKTINISGSRVYKYKDKTLLYTTVNDNIIFTRPTSPSYIDIYYYFIDRTYIKKGHDAYSHISAYELSDYMTESNAIEEAEHHKNTYDGAYLKSVKIKKEGSSNYITVFTDDTIHGNDSRLIGYFIQGNYDPAIYNFALRKINEHSSVGLGGFDLSGYLYAYDNNTNTYTKITEIKLEYTECRTNTEPDEDGDRPGNDRYRYQIYYDSIEETYFNYVNVDYLKRTTVSFDYRTLLPFKSYNFYIHYVKKTGEITNGYFIGKKLAYLQSNLESPSDRYDPTNISGEYNTDVVIYPVFSGIKYSEEYPYCFISIAPVKNNIAQIFDTNCIDIDTLLLPLNNDIKCFTLEQLEEWHNSHTIYQLDENDDIVYDENDNPIIISECEEFDAVNCLPNQTVTYYSSGTTDENQLGYFGASGKLDIQNPQTYIDNPLFVVQANDKNQEYISLTKCTPFINEETYDSYNDLELLGYFCSVYKPTTNETTRYISGSDVYSKTVVNKVINLNDLYDVATINATTEYKIYSEFNLNYLSLVTDISTRIRSYKTSPSDNASQKQIVNSFESLTLSDIYELKSMYKAYQRKIFYPVDTSTIIEFNNTIRSSNLGAEEERVYIYKFIAVDYYNVPTNKGYVTNLKSVADLILVHTQDSLFKFTGSNKLTTQDGNAQLSESDPFDTGITEIYGSERGFVGLSNNEYTMLVYDGYVFFDKDAKRVYNYHGQGLVQVSDPIQRLINYKPIDSIKFANDYYNDRFFMLINFSNGKSANLSFNYVQKTFVSLHDFTFDKSFSTKVNCYFIKNNTLYRIDKTGTIYNDLTITDTLFPNLSNENNTKEAIVDVIFNDEFENVKTLNSISWIGSKIVSDFAAFVSINDIHSTVAESEDRTKQCVDGIQIYSDSCMTNLEDIHEKDGNTYSITNSNSYKYPVFMDGVWNYNYFRNKLTIGQKVNTSDNKSLIYGKYFVARFVFTNNNDFKLENVIFNI